MQDDWKFYRLSGKMNFLGPILGILFGTLVAIPASFIYAYAVVYIPFVYINFLISFGFGFVICVAYKLGETQGHNRSRLLSFVGTSIMSIICLYTAWAAFLFVLLKHGMNYFSILTDPVGVWSIICLLVEKGWFAIVSGSGKVNGAFYAALLSIEAAFYYLILVWLGMLDSASVYCERCSKWLEQKNMPFLLDIEIENDIKQTAETGNFPWLNKSKLANNLPAILLSECVCDTCDDVTLLSATKLVMIQKEDKSEKQETVLFKNLIVTKKRLEEIKATLEALDDVRSKELASSEKIEEKNSGENMEKPPEQKES